MKRSKCSHKEFYRWMGSEINDFYPDIILEDPLKRLNHLLEKTPLRSIPRHQRKKLAIGKPRSTKVLKHGPNFNIEEYWRQLSSKFTENFIKFLDLKDVIMLMYTCEYFHEVFDQESMWESLRTRDFSSFYLGKLRDDTRDRVSDKLYYKYLYLSKVSGVPFHSGYFKAYGSPDIVELSDSIVDFVCPKNEMTKKYTSEILMRNHCKTFDFKLSWLKEKKQICLWNGNSSLQYIKPETGDEEIQTVNEFYPCFIKRYAKMEEDEEIVKAFFLEDKYLVVKLKKNQSITIFRVLNFEEELYSIAKGLHEPVIPYNYSFILKDDESDLINIKNDEFGIDFTIYQEKECDMKMNLLSGDRAVFYSENSAKPTLIFWDLKEKKKIDFVSIELKKPLSNIIVSKKSDGKSDKIKLFILDENMNVYCGSLSEKDGFVLNQTIILPIEVEEEIEKPQEPEATDRLNSGKGARNKRGNSLYEYLFDSSPPKYLQELDQKFESKTRKFYHEVWNKTNEEWLIVHIKKKFHFVNLDQEKIQEFSAAKDIGLFESGNWTVSEDTLLITHPTKIFYYKINFEDHRVSFKFFQQFERLEIGNIVKQWVMLDSCFTVMIFTHTYGEGLTARATIVITSTQEFLYNTDPYFNYIPCKVEADQFIRIPENKYREIDFKFEDSKVLVLTEKANFFFDMTLSAQPYSQVYLNGWMSNSSINTIRYGETIADEAEPAVSIVEEEVKPTKPKIVNYLKLEGNPNIMNENNGLKISGKSQWKKEEDKKSRVVKSKGDKYHKNIRQSQRSAKVN